MKEDKEILTTKDRLDFLKRKPFWLGILFFTFFPVIVLWGFGIYGIYNEYFINHHYKSIGISLLYMSYLAMFLAIIHLFQWSRLIYFIQMKDRPKEEFVRFEYYAVNFFQDKLEFNIHKAFFGCDSYWLDQSYALKWSQIEAVQFDGGKVFFTLNPVAIDSNPELIKIVGRRFRISKKLAKNDRTRLLDVLKIHIERAKAA